MTETSRKERPECEGPAPRSTPGAAAPWLVGLGVAALLLAAAGPAARPLEAQARSGGGTAAADTLSADSARARIFRNLQTLGKPPGLDSARAAADTTNRSRVPEAGRASGGGGAQAPQDSVSQELSRLPGYQLVDYSGAEAEFDTRSDRLVLRGTKDEKPVVSQQGMTLTADSAIVYDREAGRVRAIGGAEYTPETGEPVQSQTLVLDLNQKRGSAVAARTRYDEGSTQWIIRGDLPSVAPEVVYGSKTSFTSCDLDDPHYHFETDEIKIVHDHVLVARPVRLYFADVPVAWLPFIAQSLSQGRSSGLLTPRFSVNDIVRTSQGYSRRISNVGFYWAMSDYTDATVALDWFSNRYTSVTGSFRYRWLRQFLNGGVNFREYWKPHGREFALDTQHSWDLSERTHLSVQGAYASSTDFVKQNSFDPREVTQTIRSQGGLNHRFDWGSLNVGANSQQFLSDNRVEMTLPNASLTFNPLTFFKAPPNRARFYNNITWNGSVSGNRQIENFPDQALDSSFTESRLDQVNTRATASSNWTLGNFSLPLSMKFSRDTRKGVPDFYLDPAVPDSLRTVAARLAAGLPVTEAPRVQVSGEELSWSVGASYQQRLIGSTTLTPRVSFQGRAIRSDTLSAASGFVSAPSRPSFGARLKTDVFGFYPGVGSFDRIRHKISPGISWDYSPEVTPTPVQKEVFGPTQLQTRSVLSLSLNQTFEASVKESAADTAQALPAADTARALNARPLDSGAGPAPADTTGSPAPTTRRRSAFDDEGLQRVETGRKVTLLALQTSMITYDFVQADSAGSFLGGFTTTTLNNSVRSDYLQGLSLQFQHDLFRTEKTSGTGGPLRPGQGRTFAPHLSSVNLSFSMSSSSALFRWLGLTGGGEESQAQGQAGAEAGASAQDPFAPQNGTDESSIVPTNRAVGNRQRPRSPGRVGQWRANISYSLQRPRDPSRPRNQMLQATLNFHPTKNWDVNWRTSYDLEQHAFQDHMIRLTRDLHRWQANFDFLQTPTGNWSFRFAVELLDNQDLKFDYQQHSNLPR